MLSAQEDWDARQPAIWPPPELDGWGLADNDTVELSNLQRQILFTTADIGKLKVTSASEKLKALNPEVDVQTYPVNIGADNVRDLVRDYDFVISATDTFASKYLINDACLMEEIPFSHAGIVRTHGQTVTVIPHQTACFRCIFSEPPPSGTITPADQAGVLGSAAGIMGTIQATEALKYLTGLGNLLTNTILSVDAASMDFQKINIRRDSHCPICGENPSITELREMEG